MTTLKLSVVALLLSALTVAAPSSRIILPLDGLWEIADSAASAEPPRTFTARVPVPGLAHLATPPFPDIDQFDSRELIDNRIRRKSLPASARITSTGIPRQQRNYFWYRRTFRPDSPRTVAILKVNKAQSGTAVWLNGKYAGEHLGCFTAGFFDVSKLVNWTGENELLIRIGAHPAVLPPNIPAGTDYEKLKWTPGIYDSVSITFTGDVLISTVQVAPRIEGPSIIVETVVRNNGASPARVPLTHTVRPWRGNTAVAATPPQALTLAAGEQRTVRATIRLPGARLWTPEDPKLYTLETRLGDDSLQTRFGLREFRFDTATRRAYLNGKVYFLRGSNITLHRFFEDPQSAALPWDEQWVRRLLIDIPKRMNWNSFRFCIGPVPDKWLDIADEAGLLIQHEYFIWTGGNDWHKEWDAATLKRELGEWVRDSWNHPSIAIWDAANETVANVLGDEVVPEVRKLDLSNRPWENAYNLPAGPDDPYEDHPYLFGRIVPGRTPPFRITDLERMEHHKQSAAAHPSAHASILNEYGWLWLNRDGSPTVLTDEVWETLLGKNATGPQRLKEWAYLLGGLTEFWRAHRFHAGLLHFVYLTCSYPGVYTSDHWRDLVKLELDQDFEDYVGQAFRPLGVYLNFWQSSWKPGSKRTVAVSLINDHLKSVSGTLALTLHAPDGTEHARQEKPFELNANGQHTYSFEVTAPRGAGEWIMKAAASPASGEPTISRRKFRCE